MTNSSISRAAFLSSTIVPFPQSSLQNRSNKSNRTKSSTFCPRFTPSFQTLIPSYKTTSITKLSPTSCMQSSRALHLHPSTVGRLVPALASPQQLRLHILPISTFLDRLLTSILLLIVLHLAAPPFPTFCRLTALLFPLWRAFLSACSQNARLRVRTKASRVRLIIASATGSDNALYVGSFRIMGVNSHQMKQVLNKTCCALVVGGIAVEAFCPDEGIFVGNYPYVRRGIFRKVCGKALQA